MSSGNLLISALGDSLSSPFWIVRVAIHERLYCLQRQRGYQRAAKRARRLQGFLRSIGSNENSYPSRC